MSKYHINAKGVPAPCKANKISCPFGGTESHYNSIEEAQIAVDKLNEIEHGYLPPIETKKEKFAKCLSNLRSSRSLKEQEYWRTELAELSKNNNIQDKVKMSEILKNISEPDGGATISLSNEYEVTIPTTGFCASPYPEYSKVFNRAEDVTFESMMDFMNNIKMHDENILENDDEYIGLWNDPQTGKIYLDVSKRYSTAKDARIACEEKDQIAYFDLQLFESVDVDRSATSGQMLSS